MSHGSPSVYSALCFASLSGAVMMLLVGPWFLYDGMIGYPRQRERALAYQRIQHEHEDNWEQAWQDTAKARGWPVDDPGPPKTEGDIRLQLIFGTGTTTIALVCLILAGMFVYLHRSRGKPPASNVRPPAPPPHHGDE